MYHQLDVDCLAWREVAVGWGGCGADSAGGQWEEVPGGGGCPQGPALTAVEGQEGALSRWAQALRGPDLIIHGALPSSVGW